MQTPFQRPLWISICRVNKQLDFIIVHPQFIPQLSMTCCKSLSDSSSGTEDRGVGVEELIETAIYLLFFIEKKIHTLRFPLDPV